MKNKISIVLFIFIIYITFIIPKSYAAETWASGSIAAKTYTSNTTINLTGNVTLNGQITINSGVTVTIKGAGKITRASTYTGIMFLVNDGGSLVVTGSEGNNDDIIITGNGSNVTAESPVIDCSEKLKLTNVTIKNNKGTKKGGCILAQPKDVDISITNCVISGCTSKHGSALYLVGAGSGPVNVTRTIIQNCEILGDGWGGTIRTNGGGNWKLTLEDCVIRNNTSTWGGCILWNSNGEDAKLEIKDCQILNNSATYCGGGCDLQGSSMAIYASLGEPTSALENRRYTY